MKTNTHFFFITSCSITFRMSNVSDESCRENQNSYFMFKNIFFKIMSFMRQCGKVGRPHYTLVHAHCTVDT